MKKSNLDIKEDCVVLSVNPKVYPIDAVYSAAYVFLDRAYILLDGDPKKEILVELKPKNEEGLEKLGRDFNNELINYADYKKRSKNTKKIREMLLQRALITNDPSTISNSDLGGEFEELMNDSEEDDYLEDPKGIAIPWEEKYGAKKNENKTK
jgi:His-Xaa-Ser system protein HxsD